MNRLTITLNENRYRALKEAAARRHKTIGQLVDESLEFYGIKTQDDAVALVRRAREKSGLTENEAMALALRETRKSRRP
ncbi:MAG TPA: hypothetical protein VFL78_08700 [Rhodanobacteraceae bacterium]|nr:hypothetical protein [Rhodanobacteraceae bacterium]